MAIGKLAHVDLVAIGAVTGFGYRSRKTHVLFFGAKTTQEAESTVDVRIIEVATGRIVASDTGRGVVTIGSGHVLGVGTSAGYDETIASNSLRAAISKFVDTLIDSSIEE